MLKELAEWQINQDYAEGVILYRKYGRDSVLLSLFALPETSFTSGKLAAALLALAPGESTEKDKPEPVGVTPKPVLELIRKRSQLHESLFHTPGKTDRHTIAQAILSIGSTLDRYYDHGELPSDQVENSIPENDIPVNGWELHQQINNNMAYLAKNKNREDKQGEIKRRDRQNTLIEERLKNMKYETAG